VGHAAVGGSGDVAVQCWAAVRWLWLWLERAAGTWTGTCCGDAAYVKECRLGALGMAQTVKGLAVNLSTRAALEQSKRNSGPSGSRLAGLGIGTGLEARAVKAQRRAMDPGRRVQDGGGD
jgi:hypothetical protein